MQVAPSTMRAIGVSLPQSPLISRRVVRRLLSSLFTHAWQTFLGRADLFGHTFTKLQHTWMDIVEMIESRCQPCLDIFSIECHESCW